MKAVCLHCPAERIDVSRDAAWLRDGGVIPCPSCGRRALIIRATFNVRPYAKHERGLTG